MLSMSPVHHWRCNKLMISQSPIPIPFVTSRVMTISMAWVPTIKVTVKMPGRTTTCVLNTHSPKCRREVHRIKCTMTLCDEYMSSKKHQRVKEFKFMEIYHFFLYFDKAHKIDFNDTHRLKNEKKIVDSIRKRQKCYINYGFLQSDLRTNK